LRLIGGSRAHAADQPGHPVWLGLRAWCGAGSPTISWLLMTTPLRTRRTQQHVL